MHSTVVKYSNLITNIDIAQKAGFDSLELTRDKLYDYLDAGYTTRELRALTKDLDVRGVGWVENIERQGKDFEVLLEESKRLFDTANQVGAGGVQLLTGPLDINAVRAHATGAAYHGYMGLLGKTIEEQIELTVQNVSALADLAKQYDLCLYLEPLGWAPLNSVMQAVKIAEKTQRQNVKVVIDFWHCHVVGVKPEDIETIPKDLIYGVHISDSLRFDGGLADETVLRNVALGEGVVPLDRWVQAVKATGYDGWWGSEVFSKKLYQQDPLSTAKHLYTLLADLISIKR